MIESANMSILDTIIWAYGYLSCAGISFLWLLYEEEKEAKGQSLGKFAMLLIVAAAIIGPITLLYLILSNFWRNNEPKI